MPIQPLDPFPWGDVAILVALVMLNGVFSLAELAIVSARRPRLEAMARTGRKGARVALELGADPGRFLSTVQVGITLIAVVEGAFSGEALGHPVAERLARLGLPADRAETIGFVLVIAITTYVSLIGGELVPKQAALRAPEPIAVAMAPVMRVISRVAAPIVWLLDGTSLLVFRLFGVSRDRSHHVTAEELHLVVAEASRSGVIEESERAIISGVVRLADRPVREVMTPRTEIEWLDLGASEEGVRACLARTRHSRLPVAEGSVDEIVGVVQARDVVAVLLAGDPIDLRALMHVPTVVPDQVDAMDALEALRRGEVPMALVRDEYGHIEGLVTPADLMRAIAGDYATAEEGETDPALVKREDGSWLVSGSLPADALAERLDIDLPEDRDYATAAGFALSVLRHLPIIGERFDVAGWRFEVIDMDGRKIDKLLAQAVGE